MSSKVHSSIKSFSSTNQGDIAEAKTPYMPSDVKYVDTVLSVRWLNHFIFWVVLTLSTAYHGSLYGGLFIQNLANMVSLLPIHILTAYTAVYFIIPRFLFRKKWIVFALVLILLCYTSAVISRLLIVYVAEPLVRGEVDKESLWQIVKDPIYLLQVYVPSLLLPTLLLFLIKMTKERFSQRNREAQLIKEKQSTEINFLKAQMNPHLLFNTLNNIYSLAQSGSEDTPEMILKLSDIMDYTLYECRAAEVLVTREWELIENYADLEVLRFSDQVNLLLSERIDNSQAKIAPLLLIPIVENAFKYGLKTSHTDPEIKIDLTVKEGFLQLKTSNTKDKSHTNQSVQHGIGLKNLRRQLNIHYPERHQLILDESEDRYNVNLKIEL